MTTLKFRIIVYVRLFFSAKFSTLYGLIRDYTIIDFRYFHSIWSLFGTIRLLTIKYYSVSMSYCVVCSSWWNPYFQTWLQAAKFRRFSPPWISLEKWSGKLGTSQPQPFRSAVSVKNSGKTSWQSWQSCMMWENNGRTILHTLTTI